ncbi:WD repeat-containing protein 60 [Amphibalanus amphitrite]|uniref:WD repeat-containing protein 60 n=1 Tax=Amphibalanus amphitrite TaxID=1232801 RepID=A0A6A4WXC4_AMPAM|nr:WD repeat-containing protein 60 [Amphibalanus amphitrite]
MDEVYTARAVELAGGRLYGEGKDGVTSTIFCTFISSVAGSYEDIISMSPVTSITTSDIRNIFFTVLKTLTEIGFTVVSCTTDGHRTNQGFHNSLGEDGRHPEFIINPYSPDARVYTMFDTVHLYKNFFFNLLNKKTLICQLPTTETVVKAEYNHLQQLYRMEMGQDIKMAYRLTDRVIHPTTVERVNVQLAVAATHETTVAALRFYGQKEEHCNFRQTADFLEMLKKWFSIVNTCRCRRAVWRCVPLYPSVRLSVPADVSVPARCLALCPFEQPFLLAGGADGSLRLHTTTGERPLITWNAAADAAPVLALHWSQHRPCVFFVLDADSSAGDIFPAETDQVQSGPVTAMDLSYSADGDSRVTHLAVSTADGALEVHTVAETYTHSQAGELDQFLHYVRII